MGDATMIDPAKITRAWIELLLRRRDQRVPSEHADIGHASIELA
jgi:hypothetical protein